MTDSKNAVTLESQHQPGHEVLATQPNKPHEDDTGSIWSHLGYGVLSLALVAPMFLPGFLESRLFLVYLGLWAILVIGGSLWGVVASLGATIRAHRLRRRSWLT